MRSAGLHLSWLLIPAIRNVIIEVGLKSFRKTEVGGELSHPIVDICEKNNLSFISAALMEVKNLSCNRGSETNVMLDNTLKIA